MKEQKKVKKKKMPYAVAATVTSEVSGNQEVFTFTGYRMARSEKRAVLGLARDIHRKMEGTYTIHGINAVPIKPGFLKLSLAAYADKNTPTEISSTELLSND
jgi:hypothetical protein